MSTDNETPLSHVDRKAAAKLNPAICNIDARGTCDNVSSAMRTLAYMVSAVEDSPVMLNATDFYVLQNMLAAALEFEAQQNREVIEEYHSNAHMRQEYGQKPKEAPVKRIK